MLSDLYGEMSKFVHCVNWHKFSRKVWLVIYVKQYKYPKDYM